MRSTDDKSQPPPISSHAPFCSPSLFHDEMTVMPIVLIKIITSSYLEKLSQEQTCDTRRAGENDTAAA